MIVEGVEGVDGGSPVLNRTGVPLPVLPELSRLLSSEGVGELR